MASAHPFFGLKTLVTTLRTAFVCSASASLLLACGGGDGGNSAGLKVSDAFGSSGSSGTPAVGGKSISGTVIAGPVGGSTVTVYPLNADGTLGAAIGTGTTTSTGGFALTLSSAPTGAVVLVAHGGTYVSETDGVSVSLASDLTALVPSIPAAGLSGIVITPVSAMLVARTLALVKAGSTLADALSSTEALIESTYGLTTGSLETLLPTYDKASIGTSAFTLGLVIGSLDGCDKLLPAASRGALYAALAADFSDGVFDGKAGSTAVTVGGGGSLSSTAGTSDFLACVATYASSAKAVTDAGITSADLSATTTGLRTAVVASAATPKSVGLLAGSSGAISSLAYGGKQWVFMAARDQGVVAIDVTDPTAATPTVKVYNTLPASFGGLPIGGVVPLLGADHPQLLVFAYGSKHIALVNADTGAVEYQTDLTLTATSPVSFSGGSAFIAGAIPDTARDGVWLATADGYLFFDRNTKTVTTSYGIDSSSELAENVGGDVLHGMLFAANYSPGVQLVDLAAAKSYYFDGTAFSTTPGFSNLREPDAGSVDSGYQVGIITNEDTDDVGFVNLKTIVKTDAPSASTKSTFVPGTGGSAYLALGGPTLSGSAVDSDTHLALFMAGYSTDIAVGMLQDPASVASGGTWTGLTDWRFVKNLTGYSIARDPHAVASIKNLSNGKAYGYLLDGGAHKGFQVDLAALLAATPAATTGTDAHRIATDPTTTGEVKTISW